MGHLGCQHSAKNTTPPRVAVRGSRGTESKPFAFMDGIALVFMGVTASTVSFGASLTVSTRLPISRQDLGASSERTRFRRLGRLRSLQVPTPELRKREG